MWTKNEKTDSHVFENVEQISSGNKGLWFSETIPLKESLKDRGF